MPLIITKPLNTRQKGVGLIEILITVVLLSIGFIAAAKMQMQGMRFSQKRIFSITSVFLTSDMIDRMRANFEGVNSGLYNNTYTSATRVSPGCDQVSCSPTQLAQQDLFDWSTKLYSMTGDPNFIPSLPSSDPVSALGTITPLGDGIYEVRMSWSEVIDGEEKASFVLMNFAPEVVDP